MIYHTLAYGSFNLVLYSHVASVTVCGSSRGRCEDVLTVLSCLLMQHILEANCLFLSCLCVAVYVVCNSIVRSRCARTVAVNLSTVNWLSEKLSSRVYFLYSMLSVACLYSLVN